MSGSLALHVWPYLKPRQRIEAIKKHCLSNPRELMRTRVGIVPSTGVD